MSRFSFPLTVLGGVFAKRLLPSLILTTAIASASLSAQSVDHSKALPPLAACDPDKVEFPLEVLTDTTGTDFHQYVFGVVRKIINRHAASQGEAASDDKSCATVEFSIEKDGKLAGMKLVQSSGDATLEKSALDGIAASAPFSPLPDGYSGGVLVLRFHFHHNSHQNSLSRFGPQDGHGQGALIGNAGPAGTPIEGKTYQGQPVYRTGRGVTTPTAINQPVPEYTESARRSKLTGSVELEVVVTPEGTVDDVKVMKGLGLGLDERAIDTVRQWKFRPATKDGVAVPALIKVEVTFHLM